MRDKYTDVIRIGKISSINPDNGTAQVTFEDRDGIVSGDLHIEFSTTLEDQEYYMPAIGERVRVEFDPESPSRGCIKGSYYADTRLPPIKNKNKRYILFKDKTLIEYDKELHKLTIRVEAGGEKSIDIITESDVNVKTNGNVKVEAAKNAEITAENVSITGNTSINLVVGETQLILTPGGIKVVGDIEQSGEHTDSIGTHV